MQNKVKALKMPWDPYRSKPSKVCKLYKDFGNSRETGEDKPLEEEHQSTSITDINTINRQLYVKDFVDTSPPPNGTNYCPCSLCNIRAYNNKNLYISANHPIEHIIAKFKAFPSLSKNSTQLEIYFTEILPKHISLRCAFIGYKLFQEHSQGRTHRNK
uniref:Uncharacterized protein n=1 Tax=Glossina austeni TaxID=7395 RepID=A0A1A9URC7_GLOAU